MLRSILTARPPASSSGPVYQKLVARVPKDQCGYGPNTEETHKDYGCRRCGVRTASEYSRIAYRSNDIVVRTLILVVRFSFVWKTRSNKGLTPGGTRRFLILLPTSEFSANALSVTSLDDDSEVTLMVRWWTIVLRSFDFIMDVL